MRIGTWQAQVGDIFDQKGLRELHSSATSHHGILQALVGAVTAGEPGSLRLGVTIWL